jgi:uncharacterized UPF0160 family protein
MNWLRNKKTVVVHPGGFHADDVFSVATLSLHLKVSPKRFNIIRTRDLEIIKRADYVFDVGFINNQETRFDHHQVGGAGTRDNGIPFASFGSVWKSFGQEICQSKEVADYLDAKMVSVIDAEDCGVNITKSLFTNVVPFTVSDFIFHFNPTKKEGKENIDNVFLKAVLMARDILEREIKIAKELIEEHHLSEELIKKIYNESSDKRILVLKEDILWKDIVNKFPEPLFVVVKNDSDDSFRVYGVRDDLTSFQYRKLFPESWGGKQKEDLVKICGVKDALFCHVGRFMCVAKTIEGAIALAQRVINN